MDREMANQLENRKHNNERVNEEMLLSKLKLK